MQIINETLDLAKVESGRIEFSPQPVDLAELVGEVSESLHALAEEKHLHVERSVEASLTDVIVDPSRLKQVLYNYLSNAIKFTPDDGEIGIAITSEGTSRFRLEVRDTGIGIAPADIKRLFVDFQQLDTGMGKHYQGTGLGLALIKRLVEAQGGTVGVTSVLGEGSCFHAILPRIAAEAISPSL
jgi:signal transduction histidine kinase